MATSARKPRESRANPRSNFRQKGPARPNNQQRQMSPQAQSKRPQGRVGAAIAYSSAQRTGVSRNVRPVMGGHDRVVHRELVGSIDGSTAYQTVKFICNPGNSTTFPWLSVQAKQYEQYRFHKLNFEFITRTSTTTVGSVLLSPDYDPTDAAPQSEAVQSSYQDCVEDVPWRDQICVLKTKSMFPTGERKFVRSGNVVGDLKLYDAANMFVGTVDETGVNMIGKLWVSYDVEFFVPQTISAGSTGSSAAQSSFFENAANQSIPSATLTRISFDTKVSDALGIVGQDVNDDFILPKGAYNVQCNFTYTNSSGEIIFRVIPYVNGVALNYGDMTGGSTFNSGGSGPSTGAVASMAYVESDGTTAFGWRCITTFASGTTNITGASATTLFTLA